LQTKGSGSGTGSGPDSEWFLQGSAAAVAHGVCSGGTEISRHQPGRQRWLIDINIDIDRIQITATIRTC